MEIVDSYERMRAAPMGRAVVGPHFLHWCAAADLLGVTLWGRPTAEDVGKLLAVLDSPPMAQLAPRCGWIFDATRVESVDREVFEDYLKNIGERRGLLAARMERLALVRPHGLTGAVVAGLSGLLDLGVPTALFEDLAAGLRWLRADAGGLSELLDRLVRPLAEGGILIARLRALLAAEPARMRIDLAARELGLSARSLQRALHAQGTSFRAELHAVRFTHACKLLRETDLKLEVIGLRIGCTSAAHFATFFRAHSGQSPSAWRATQRHGG